MRRGLSGSLRIAFIPAGCSDVFLGTSSRCMVVWCCFFLVHLVDYIRPSDWKFGTLLLRVYFSQQDSLIGWYNIVVYNVCLETHLNDC